MRPLVCGRLISPPEPRRRHRPVMGFSPMPDNGREPVLDGPAGLDTPIKRRVLAGKPLTILLENRMSIEDAIIKLLKSEGYRVNEPIRDAIADLIDVVDEENEMMDDAEVDEAEADEEDDL